MRSHTLRTLSFHSLPSVLRSAETYLLRVQQLRIARTSMRAMTVDRFAVSE